MERLVSTSVYCRSGSIIITSSCVSMIMSECNNKDAAVHHTDLIAVCARACVDWQAVRLVKEKYQLICESTCTLVYNDVFQMYLLFNDLVLNGIAVFFLIKNTLNQYSIIGGSGSEFEPENLFMVEAKLYRESWYQSSKYWHIHLLGSVRAEAASSELLW